VKVLTTRSIRTRFFIRNFFLFIIPALTSIAIIGVLSFWFAYGKVKLYIENNNAIILDKTMGNIDSVIKEMEYLNINLSSNSSIKTRLKRILSNKPLILTADDHTVFRTILDMIFVSANSNKYIHSIYIYFESAGDLFITSTQKQINTLSDSNDSSWYDSYISFKDNPESSWTELRRVTPNPGGNPDEGLLTLYSKMYSTLSGKKVSDGVLVINIYANKLNSLLDSAISTPNQILLVADDKNNMIFGSSMSSKLSESDIASISADYAYINSKNEKYVVTQKSFEKFNWRFISLTPHNTLYEIPNQILISMSLGFFLSIVLGIIFAIHNTKKAYVNFSSLLSIIESTQRGESVSDLKPPCSNSEYSFIIHNLLKTFIEHDYLKVQLSEKKYKMQVLELQAMQAQMNPHFLLNAMEVIYWKAMNLSHSPNEASALIQDISNILHYSLYNPMQMVCILEEIDIAKSYINIQMGRHKGLFNVIWDYDPMLVEYRINKLVLQPILENAIYHGRRGENHRLIIKIKIYLHENGIRISVIDNGKGIPAEKLSELKEMLNRTDMDFSQHIGLYNTHRRLLMHGEPYGLKILSHYNIGTVVRMYLPLIS